MTMVNREIHTVRILALLFGYRIKPEGLSRIINFLSRDYGSKAFFKIIFFIRTKMEKIK